MKNFHGGKTYLLVTSKKDTLYAHQAQKIFFNSIPREKIAKKERIKLEDSLNRVLAEDIYATKNLPPFNRAAMDGFAVKSEDIKNASQTTPVILNVIGTIEIGEEPKLEIHHGETVRINTGAPIPKGSDCVVMIEDTNWVDHEKIAVFKSLPPLKNVSLSGEDVKKGELILKKGTILCPQDIALLKSIGIKEILVWKKLRVALFSTGNEIINQMSENPRDLYKIVDANRPMLHAMLKEDGAEVIDFGIVEDDEDKLRKTLLKALSTADIVITSGGTSKGTRDFMPSIVNSLGSPGILVQKTAIAPGKPITLALVGHKPVIILPGYPVASFINYTLYVRPLLQYITQSTYRWRPYEKIKAQLATTISSKYGIREFYRVKIEITAKNENHELILVHPIFRRGAGILSSLTRCDAILEVPEAVEELKEGTTVEITSLRYI